MLLDLCVSSLRTFPRLQDWTHPTGLRCEACAPASAEAVGALRLGRRTRNRAATRGRVGEKKQPVTVMTIEMKGGESTILEVESSHESELRRSSAEVVVYEIW